MSNHANIAFFIPHLGCPYHCIFCDQYQITGSDAAVTPLSVFQTLARASRDPGLDKQHTQIAFFGGSFTAIERPLMIDYLTQANRFIGKDQFQSIRISTRPDCIDKHTLSLLKEYNVLSIELGVQSFDDEVLTASRRGYTAQAAERACRMIIEHGFELGVQMMCGLPQDTPQKDIATANRIIGLGCRQVRIYPVIVLKNTVLHSMYMSGDYQPLSLDDAVDTCAKLYTLFHSNDVKVLKMGLHSSNDHIAGPFHPAFGELVRSKAIYDSITAKLKINAVYEITVAPALLSTVIGNRKRNLALWKAGGYHVRVFPDQTVSLAQQYQIKKQP